MGGHIINHDRMKIAIRLGEKHGAQYERRRKGVVVERAKVELKPVYLNVRNPFDMDAPLPQSILDSLPAEHREFLDATKDSKMYGQRGRTTGAGWFASLADFGIGEARPHSNKIKARALEYLKSLGYDGITHIGGNIIGGGKQTHRVWIAFEPTQIKAVDNAGTFDPNDPNMRKAL